MKKHTLIIVVLLSLLTFKGYTQRLNFKNYTIENGLSSNFIYQVIQDKKGYIWMCGETGLTRYDGKTFTNYTSESGLQDNEVLKIFEDSRGRIWYLTLKGRIGFIKDGVVDRQDALNKLVNDLIFCVNEDCDGSLIISTNRKGIFKISNNKIIANYINKRLFQGGFASYNETHMWLDNTHINCRTGEIVSFGYLSKLVQISRTGRISEIQDHNYDDELLRDIPFKGAMMLYTVASNIQAKTDLGLVQVDSNLTRSILATSKELGPETRLCAEIDRNGELWVGTVDGIVRLSKENGVYRFKAKYLRGRRISGLLEDREGNIWAASMGEGIYIFSATRTYTITTTTTAESDGITALALDAKGRMYVGSDHGMIYNFENNGLTLISDGKGNKVNLGFNRVNYLVPGRNNRIWAGKDDGLYVYDDAKLIDHSPTGSVKGLSVRPDNEAWFANHGGIQYTENEHYEYHETNDVLYNVGRPSALANDGDTLWFWANEGLVKHHGNKLKYLFQNSQLLSERISKIQRDKNGVMWMASQGKGLVYWKGNSLGVINSKNGLVNNSCNSFYIEGDTVIWVATNGGISRITFKNKDLTNYSIQNITTRQGLASNKVTSIVIRGQVVYAGTSKGLSFFNRSEVVVNKTQPPIFIAKVKIWDKDTAVLPYYELGYRSNNITIEYSGLSFKSLGSVSYKYQMEGVDSTWIRTNYNSASFPILPPGQYTFKVKCINEDGTESAEPAIIRIKISSPYWQRWWFYITSSIIGIAITFFIFNSRFKRLEEKNQLRQQALEEEQKALRAQMNPHFIFNALNSIQHFILNKNILSANEYLSKFAGLIRRILDNSQHSFISIYDEMETIRLYVEIESHRFDSSFEFEIVIDEDVDKYNTEIPPMIIQPYVENAIWHGLLHRETKGKLLIHLYKQRNSVVCAIEDNGIGRQRSQQISRLKKFKTHKSVGMEITKERLTNISQIQRATYTVIIHDLVDNVTGEPRGTRVELTFPEDPNSVGTF